MILLYCKNSDFIKIFYRRKKMLVDIKKEIHRKLKFYACQRGLTMTNIAENAISEYIENHVIDNNDEQEASLI
jgi:predicted peroxiredoxin